MDRITVMIAPDQARVRLLATTRQREIFKASLGPVSTTHPRAATTLIEGLALWQQQPVSVVLCADDSGDSSALHLYDALGLGGPSLHFDVGVVWHPRGARCRRLRLLGDFRDLRQLGIYEGASR